MRWSVSARYDADGVVRSLRWRTRGALRSKHRNATGNTCSNRSDTDHFQEKAPINPHLLASRKLTDIPDANRLFDRDDAVDHLLETVIAEQRVLFLLEVLGHRVIFVR